MMREERAKVKRRSGGGDDDDEHKDDAVSTTGKAFYGENSNESDSDDKIGAASWTNVSPTTSWTRTTRSQK